VSAQLKITLRKSRISSTPQQRAALRGLGLRRMHASVLRPDDDAIRGLVNRVSHLVEVEPVAEPPQD
jgi:large subunit ribosomal protein L30